MNRRSLLKAGLVVGSGVFGALTSAQVNALPSKNMVDDFYKMNFKDVDGNQHAVENYESRILIVNFWATWCPPCVKEMPVLNQIYNTHDGVTVVGLAVDTLKNVTKFSSKVSVDYPILMAGHDGIQLMKSLGNSKGGLPYTLIFDANGVAKHKFLGEVTLDMLEPLLS